MGRALTYMGAVWSGTIQQLIDCDSLQGPITLLSGSADAINPHVAGNYIVSRAGVDAMTIGAPTPGTDDNLSLNIWSDTLNAHTLTASAAIFATGAGMSTVVTFKAFRGSGLTLRAFNGTWQVLGSNVTSFA